MPSGLPLPQSRLRRVLASTTTYDAAIAVFALLTAVAAMEKNGKVEWSWSHLLPFATFAAVFVKVVLSARKEHATPQLHAIEGALHTLHRFMLDSGTVPPGSDPKLRVTLHVPDSSEHLVQLLDYVGDQRARSTAGRRTPSNCGIIGAALTTKEMAYGKRETPDREAYVQELKDRWHFQEDAARKLDASTMSWLAIPLRNAKGGIVAILYADSIDPGFFTDMRVLAAASGAVGIAEFVNTRLL